MFQSQYFHDQNLHALGDMFGVRVGKYRKVRSPVIKCHGFPYFFCHHVNIFVEFYVKFFCQGFFVDFLGDFLSTFLATFLANIFGDLIGDFFGDFFVDFFGEFLSGSLLAGSG